MCFYLFRLALARWEALTVVPANWTISRRRRGRHVPEGRRLPAIVKLWDVRWNFIRPPRPVRRLEGRKLLASFGKKKLVQKYTTN